MSTKYGKFYDDQQHLANGSKKSDQKDLHGEGEVSHILEYRLYNALHSSGVILDRLGLFLNRWGVTLTSTFRPLSYEIVL